MKIGVIMYQTSATKGQEIVAQNMVRGFRKLAHEAYLITGPYHDGIRVVPTETFEKSLEGYLLLENSDLQIPVIRVEGYISEWPPRRVMFRYFSDTLRRIAERFELDVLITHSTLWNGPEDTAKFVLWRRTAQELGLKQRDIIYCHMSHFQEPHPLTYPVIERAYRIAWNSLVLPQIFQVANLILEVSPLSKNEMIRLGAKEEQCHLFPGGIDEEIFKLYKDSDFEQFRRKYSIPEGRKIISYVGTIEKRKNPLAVAKVARRLHGMKDVHFIIAGRRGNQEEDVKSFAGGLDNLSYVGEITTKEKVQLIKGSYLNILMSRMEALGLAQLEFMYNGVPVVTSAVGGQKWVVRDGKDGVHVNGPDDVEGAAKAIKYLVENPDVREEMSKNARERSQEFTLTRIMRDLERKLLSFTQ
jgi:glycosyltransferase involved in cell wall biosynthesis